MSWKEKYSSGKVGISEGISMREPQMFEPMIRYLREQGILFCKLTEEDNRDQIFLLKRLAGNW